MFKASLLMSPSRLALLWRRPLARSGRFAPFLTRSPNTIRTLSFTPTRYQETATPPGENKPKTDTLAPAGKPPSAKVADASREAVEETLHTEQAASEEDVSDTSDDDTPAPDEFLTTIFENMEPYIDTYLVYKQLRLVGLEPSQCDEIINLLVVQLNSKLLKLLTKYLQLYELENERYLFESAQQELRVDITRNREQHINEAINQINVLERDYGIISDELNNQFIQMKNDIQVAINDQKSENTLLSKKIQLKIQETNHKISTELNMAMRSEIESLRWHLSRWGLIAILLSVFSACTTFYIYKIDHQRQMTEKNDFVPLVIYEPSEFDEDDYHADMDPNAI